MALQLVVDSLDSVPEALRDQYKAADGKFRLDLDGYEDPVGLKSALQKEREAAKNAAKESAHWKSIGKTSEEIQQLLEKQRELEEQTLISEKKYEELHNKRTERMKAEHEKALKAEQDARNRAETQAKAFRGRVLDDAIRGAAVKAGIHAHAHDDALFRARTMFSLDDKGAAIAVGEDGQPILGKDGKTPFTPAEWLESMREKAPHWWPATQGGGASGGGGGNNNAPAGDWTGNEADRLAAIRKKFPDLRK